MKSSIKRMSALLTMMAVAVFALTFTACSDDDEPIAGVTYTYGFFQDVGIASRFS